MSVGIVLVSHSALIAHGLVDLARQMAPTVALVPAGGSGDGTRDDAGIGTSFDVVSAALAEAEGGDGVVVLADLGSASLGEAARAEQPRPRRRPPAGAAARPPR
ncbi:PTS-dependent dihydroxyacetone kinase phosphotransferase subunit DhaM, partial [Clavibacter phaseoli]|uniref:PTS-dependent dihydroxyacetone kinase phosphotransferase subunit DhaM n=1 Tax=Clavibacter phaseoli TaxID=1734031 RepID=UPI0036F1B400